MGGIPGLRISKAAPGKRDSDSVMIPRDLPLGSALWEPGTRSALRPGIPCPWREACGLLGLGLGLALLARLGLTTFYNARRHVHVCMLFYTIHHMLPYFSDSLRILY